MADRLDSSSSRISRRRGLTPVYWKSKEMGMEMRRSRCKIAFEPGEEAGRTDIQLTSKGGCCCRPLLYCELQIEVG